MIDLDSGQLQAVERLRTGCILVGETGSGKTLTALTWYYERVCGGKMARFSDRGESFEVMTNPKDLYVITTARKRDSLDWVKESIHYYLELSGVTMIVDSWNNIQKYVGIKDAVFIFDEQRVVGSGVWVKSFLEITKRNEWILLSATPGDTWLDYVPVFIANGFYKNRTEFKRRHVVYRYGSKFPTVDYYIETRRLVKLRDQLLVNLYFVRHTRSNTKLVECHFDPLLHHRILKDRWNIYEERPIRDAAEMCRVLRKLVNSDPSRLDAVKELFEEHGKLVIFYNFDYEWYMLLELCSELDVSCASWNGHQHQEVPTTSEWIYLVQYAAGAEAWNCTETNVIIFYSRSYSYKQTIQAAGRIDRRNTPFVDLYYYYLTSKSFIDTAITKAFNMKKDFNERREVRFMFDDINEDGVA